MKATQLKITTIAIWILQVKGVIYWIEMKMILAEIAVLQSKQMNTTKQCEVIQKLKGQNIDLFLKMQ